MLRTEFGQARIVIGEGPAHLDLISTALYTIYIIQSNVPLPMESDGFHHIDKIRELLIGMRDVKEARAVGSMRMTSKVGTSC